ncbi:MAG TPA: CAP domain-containing protein [Polyangiales bacterium]
MRPKHGLVSALLVIGASLAADSAAALELPCRQEDALSETAAELLLTGAKLRADALLPRARALGFDGVALQAHEGLDDAALIAWIKQQSDRADAPLVCGEASSEARRLVLVSARAGRLRFENQRVQGQLAPGFRAPHLVIEDRDGRPERIDLRVEQLTQGVALPAERSWVRVQLVAEGPAGPRPVAELTLGATRQSGFVAAPEPEPPAPAEKSDEKGDGRERSLGSLFARLGAFRRHEGAPSVRENQLLAVSAQRHATRVCELGKVAHRLREGEDPETRLRDEHIEARAVGEAVARASSADAALSAIFESPSHRMAVSEKGFTDAGIGRASDTKGHTCLVVLLAAWPRRIP